MRETSLDEFVDRGDGGDGEDNGSEGAATSSPGDERTEGESAAEGGSVADLTEAADEREPDLEEAAEPEPDAVEPAVSTYDWTPSGADCEACGTAVERRWRDDALLVCAECKTW